MPLPKWIARFNQRILNPKELKRGVRPVLTHVSRSSGKTYCTPLDADSVDAGYIFIEMYGSDPDWVHNIMATGSATLGINGDEFDLVSPRLISKRDAWQLLPDTTKAPAGFLKVTEYLQMDLRT